MRLPRSPVSGTCTALAHAAVIRAAADVGGQDLDLREFDVAALAAVAYQPDYPRWVKGHFFGKEISRDLD
jgi:hypothetical protein